MTLALRDNGSMDSIDCAWLAGILDGEGTFSFSNNGRQPMLAVAMSDTDVIRRLQVVTGVGTLSEMQRRPGWKPLLRWTVSRKRDVARVLLSVYPLMSIRRQARIAELTAALDGVHGLDDPRCRHGHSNWGVKPSTGHRYCKSCYYAASRRWQDRKKEEHSLGNEM